MEQKVRRRNVESLTRAVLSLQEPWRGRFVSWLAEQADAGERGDGLPLQKQVAVWLDDADLSREVALLLNKWSGKRL